MDRSSMDKIIGEMTFQMSDWSNDEKTAELGGALNANAIVRGQIALLSGRIIVTATMLDVKTTKVSSPARMQLDDVGEIFDKLPGFVGEMVKSLPKGDLVYKIGDTGPAGGLIFYDKGVVSNGWRYLEAAPAGTEVSLSFDSNVAPYVAGTMRIIGSGKTNTSKILPKLSTGKYKTGEDAASFCDNLTVNGYGDWFLPSSEEVLEMRKILARKGLGNFKASPYWTSTMVEYMGQTTPRWTSVDYVDFAPDGKRFDVGGWHTLEDLNFLVRAVRMF